MAARGATYHRSAFCRREGCEPSAIHSPMAHPGRRVLRLQPRSWPHSRTCDTCSFECVSEARGVAARQARLVGGRGDLRDGVAYGLVRLRAMIFWIGYAHLDRLISYPDVRNLSGYAAPFATVALRARAGSPGYAGRIRSLTRTQGVCGHCRRAPSTCRCPGPARNVWRSAAQGSDVGVDTLRGILGDEARGLDLRQV